MIKTTIVFAAFLWTSLCVASNPCDQVPDATFVPDLAGGCADYFTCLGGVAHPKQCPEGFYFDFSRQMCYFSEQVVCHRPENPCAGMPDGHFLPRPEAGCAAFYGCNNGNSIPLMCPDGFYFDPIRMMCNTPDLVDCMITTTPIIPTPPTTQTIPTAPTPTTPPLTTTIPTAPTGTTTPATTATIPTAPTVTTPQSTTSQPICSVCQGRPNHTLVPDSSRGCAAFLECMNGIAVWPQMCPEPFYFDYPRQMCNWPEYVDCR